MVFGEETAAVVDMVTHLQSVEGSLYKIKLSAEENLKMLEKIGNTRALYVKLADRLHNMRTIQWHETTKQQAIAKETLTFFVPLAKKLTCTSIIAQEFAELSLEILSDADH